MKTSLFLAGGLALALSLPAAAAPRANVAYGDLDFAKPADIATFNTRLEAAATKACKNQEKMQLNAERRFVRCEVLVKQDVLARLPETGRSAYAAATTAEGVATM
jgi:UrcA family protein